MKLKRIRNDTRGSTLVEYALTFPLFILLIFGIAQAGLVFWTYIGLQHGVEMAARCASINDAANNAGPPWSNQTNSLCFSTPGNPVTPNNVTSSIVKTYAANNSWGVNPTTSNFTFNSKVTCTTLIGDQTYTGNQVKATYTFPLISYVFKTSSYSLNTQSCYPTK